MADAPRLATPAVETPVFETPVLETRQLAVRTRHRTLLRRVSLQVHRGTVLALVGPSGAGKTTLLKCFNRLLDLSPGLSVEGEVLLDGQPIYRRGVDTDRLRARIGMIFQQPVIFPGSVFRNVAFGLRHEVPRRRWAERVEGALREAALWSEVEDRLDEPAVELSVGQQQRLCLARALALRPEVVLMDEPTGSLDPASTRAIEERVRRLAGSHTVVLVTHDLGQARRVSDRLGVVLPRPVDPAHSRNGNRSKQGERVGELVEVGATERLFRHPQDPEVAAYLGASFAPPPDPTVEPSNEPMDDPVNPTPEYPRTPVEMTTS